ncbi:MAG: Uma2 family endonuclease [Gemmatimonadaceae bacterium]|nr:Uma2 family endonuclease [Gloeobacterales cyanobacterium ES-bin-141]
MVLSLKDVRSWTVEEYHRMAQLGILAPEERVELIEGQVVPMSPKGPLHSATTQCAADYLRVLLAQATVRTQEPIQIGGTSEPEPDITVVRTHPRQYADRHPSAQDVFLVVEVADSSLQYDREQKARIYARAGLTDYWIIDVQERRVFVLREPGPEGYGREDLYPQEASLVPLAFPQVRVRFERLFPPA